MFEEVLKKKKHFIIIGGHDANIVIGTDYLDEVANQDWFKRLMLEKSGVDEAAELERAAEVAAEQMRIQEETMRREEAARQREQHRQALLRQQQQQQQQVSQVQSQQPQLHPIQQQPRQPLGPAPTPPQQLEFPFLDTTPDKMSPIVWEKMNQSQRDEWQKKYNV